MCRCSVLTVFPLLFPLSSPILVLYIPLFCFEIYPLFLTLLSLFSLRSRTLQFLFLFVLHTHTRFWSGNVPTTAPFSQFWYLFSFPVSVLFSGSLSPPLSYLHHFLSSSSLPYAVMFMFLFCLSLPSSLLFLLPINQWVIYSHTLS